MEYDIHRSYKRMEHPQMATLQFNPTLEYLLPGFHFRTQGMEVFSTLQKMLCACAFRTCCNDDIVFSQDGTLFANPNQNDHVILCKGKLQFAGCAGISVGIHKSVIILHIIYLHLLPFFIFPGSAGRPDTWAESPA